MRIITKIVFFHICIMDQSLINSWGGIVGGGGGDGRGEAAWASFSFNSGDNIYYYPPHPPATLANSHTYLLSD